MQKSFMTLATALGCVLTASLAHAHVGVTAAGAYANANVEASFNVGHGCEDKYDTYSIKIRIPSGVTGLRMVENSSFATVAAERNAAGDVTAVTYTKAQSAVRAADDAYYKLVLRFRLPNTPFATIYFPTTQVCKNQDGSVTSTTEWIATTAPAADAGDAPEPAPALTILPTRSPGWNKYTAGSSAIKADALFKDALIVWAGDAAYSSNPNTVAQIAAEDGVEALDTIEPGTEFWVKY